LRAGLEPGASGVQAGRAIRKQKDFRFSMQQLGITHFFNLVFGALFGWLMQRVGVHPANPHAPINDVFALEMLVALLLIAFFVVVRLTLSVEKPGPAQQIAELTHEFVGGLGEQIIGHGYERYQAFITCVGLFIVINNLFGLLVGFPGITTPTGEPSVPLGIAVLTFLYYNYHGIRVQGPVQYVKHLAGPFWWLAWLILPIEVVSHLARMMSLTVRLYANMFASDMLTLVSFSLVPIVIPSVFLGLHAFVALIQAFVFMLLTMIYLSLAVAEEH
jgi:F-type H+-transporting ATPase subunit a